MAPVTLNNVWMSAQRLPISERKILTKMLADLDSETEEERKARVASSIGQFYRPVLWWLERRSTLCG